MEIESKLTYSNVTSEVATSSATSKLNDQGPRKKTQASLALGLCKICRKKRSQQNETNTIKTYGCQSSV